MKKVKVSKEMHEVLLQLKTLGTEDFILKTHARELGFVTPTFDLLNKLSTIELAEILIKGYEVEQNPQEIVEKVFNNLPDSEKDIYYKSGILFALNAYGIKIKGIND